jgi:cytochrome c biogenesis protein CcdA
MRLRVLLIILIAILFASNYSPTLLAATPPLDTPLLQAKGVVRALYFYSVDCAHCKVVQKDVLEPLQAKSGAQLDLRMLEIGVAANYELLIRAEATFAVRAQERGIPTLVIGDKILIGEDPIRQQLPGLIERGVAQGGIDWPKVSGLEAFLQNGTLPTPLPTPGTENCEQPGQVVCAAATPIWMAYFYQTGCPKCSRAEADIQYVRSRNLQLVVDQFNVYDNAAMAQWLAERAGRKDLHTPALFIGKDALIGEEEITPQNLEALVKRYAAGGAEKSWVAFDPAMAQNGLIAQFRALGLLTVIFAGLVDGLNPCAFATLVLLVSYLTFSGRKGREVLAVGGAFTLGVFLTYLGVGLGLYKVLDLLGGLLTTLSRWVYALTALFCAVLAVASFLDFLKARQGRLEEMGLKLPTSLRQRVNAVVRSGQQARTFVVGAFVTGALVSLIELACTGQIYLPTIIFVTSIPELRVQAIGYLVLYNLLFILPLVVVFVLAYFGTTSFELGRFLERNTARVKLGAVLLFASLAVWLGLSLL